MRIKCTKCQTLHAIPNPKISSSTIRLRCKKCNRIIVVDLTGIRKRLDPTSKKTNKDNTLPIWCYAHQGKEEGPVTLRDLKEKIQRGIVGEQHEVWRVGTDKRVLLGQSGKLLAVLTGSGNKSIRTPKPRAPDTTSKDEEPKDKVGTQTRKKPDLPIDEQDPERADLLRRVLQKRDKTRENRHADRIAVSFFNTDQAKSDTGSPVSCNSQPLSLPMTHTPSSATTPLAPTTTGQLIKVFGHRTRTGIAIMACLILVLGSGIYTALTTGWLSLTPTQQPKPSRISRKALPQPDANLSEIEAQKLRDVFTFKPEEQSYQGSATPAQPGTSQVRRVRNKELNLFYNNDKKEEVAPQVPDMKSLVAAPLDIDTSAFNSGTFEAAMPEMHGETTPTAPIRTTNQMTDQQIRLVIQKHKRQIKSCLQRQLKRDPSISGKMYVVVWIKPSGIVNKVEIATPKFKGTFLEQCLIKEIKTWRFPVFEGETYQLRFPLLLTAKAN